MNILTKTISAQQIKKYLKNVVTAIETSSTRANWMYQRYEELVLCCGLAMEPKSLPQTIDFGAQKFGYWNCQQLALSVYDSRGNPLAPVFYNYNNNRTSTR